MKLPFDILNDSRVEWQLVEGAGYWEYHWEIAAGGKRASGDSGYRELALKELRRRARVWLGEGLNEGHTRPCVICDKSSRIGEATCSEECKALLDKARSELPASVL